jgi:hypothetical protein
MSLHVGDGAKLALLPDELAGGGADRSRAGSRSNSRSRRTRRRGTVDGGTKPHVLTVAAGTPQRLSRFGGVLLHRLRHRSVTEPDSGATESRRPQRVTAKSCQPPRTSAGTLASGSCDANRNRGCAQRLIIRAGKKGGMSGSQGGPEPGLHPLVGTCDEWPRSFFGRRGR